MVRPLTKTSEDGRLNRPGAIEAQIDDATALDLAALKTRLLVADRGHPQHGVTTRK